MATRSSSSPRSSRSPSPSPWAGQSVAALTHGHSQSWPRWSRSPSPRCPRLHRRPSHTDAWSRGLAVSLSDHRAHYCRPADGCRRSRAPSRIPRMEPIERGPCQIDMMRNRSAVTDSGAARARTGLATMVALSVTWLSLAGCSDDVAEPQVDITDELTAHQGQPCPDQLPVGEDPDGYGFGTREPAEELPSLLTPESLWVCKYDPRGRTQGDGQTYLWHLQGLPTKGDATLRAALSEFLDEVEPADEDRACTADLGSRWMISYSHQGDLTGVVVDDFGCQEVRLTDEPFETAPGYPGQTGSVPGVLIGPGQLLLAAIGVD